MPRRRLRGVTVALGALTLLVAARLAAQPRRGPRRELTPSGQERAQIGAALKASSLDRRDLIEAVGSRRILLVGESHFEAEPQEFTEDLVADLHARDGRGTALLLELPSGMQEAIDAYLATGEEKEMARAWRSHQALPYRPLVRWARLHPHLVTRVIAYDEPSARIAMMRLFLTDTRNATMARAILAAARAAPQDRVLAFGGRLHMMNAGRYMYDSPTRSPIGARLRADGVPASDIAAIWLFTGASPAGGAWREPGAVSLAGPAGRLRIETLEAEAVYGASLLSEVADFAVFLGPGTKLPAQ